MSKATKLGRLGNKLLKGTVRKWYSAFNFKTDIFMFFFNFELVCCIIRNHYQVFDATDAINATRTETNEETEMGIK